MTEQTSTASSTSKPPVVDQQTWRTALDELRRREKAATRELDAIAAQRRRLPMVEMEDLHADRRGRAGPSGRCVQVRRTIVYNRMWKNGAEWQVAAATGFTSQFSSARTSRQLRRAVRDRHQRTDPGGLAYRDKVGNDGVVLVVGEHIRCRRQRPARRRFGVNVCLRDGDTQPHLAHQRRGPNS